MSKLTQEQADQAIESMSETSRYRWCESNLCACLGCVNRSHLTKDVTKEQWENWKGRNS